MDIDTDVDVDIDIDIDIDSGASPTTDEWRRFAVIECVLLL